MANALGWHILIREVVKGVSHERIHPKKQQGQTFTQLDWRQANMQDSVFEDCTFVDVNFSKGQFDNLRLIDCTMHNCNFREANLQYGLFERTSFYDEKQNKGCNFYGTNLKSASLMHCDLTLSNFSRAVLYDVLMDTCLAPDTQFVMADFTQQVAKNKSVSAAQLLNSNFTRADFEGAVLEHCNLARSTLAEVSLERVNFEGADLSSTVLTPVKYGACGFFKPTCVTLILIISMCVNLILLALKFINGK